jgi:hypothetical protein
MRSKGGRECGKCNKSAKSVAPILLVLLTRFYKYNCTIWCKRKGKIGKSVSILIRFGVTVYAVQVQCSFNHVVSKSAKLMVLPTQNTKSKVLLTVRSTIANRLIITN